MNSYQARDFAERADMELRQESVNLYGRWENGHWHDLSSYQKPGDTHIILAYMGKFLSKPIDPPIDPISNNDKPSDDAVDCT